MLSYVELERVVQALSDALVGGRVERWVEPDRGRLAFSIHRRDDAGARKVVVELDARPEVARIGIIDRMPKAPATLPAFAAYLRALNRPLRRVSKINERLAQKICRDLEVPLPASAT